MKADRRSLRLSLYEAFFSSLVAGLAEIYFIAFALYRGVTVIESGLLSSLPLLFAGISPFLIHFKFRKYFHSQINSKWVRTTAWLQSIILMSLALYSLFISTESGVTFKILLLLYTIYWFGYYASLPSWNYWISELITFESSQKYFSRRTLIVQLGVLTGLVLGGLALHLNILKIETNLIFFLIFLTSFLLKMGSMILFKMLPSSTTYFNLDLNKKISLLKYHKSFFKTYSLFNFSLYLSAPYLSGYLLNVRKLNYFDYMIVIGGLFVGKILTSIYLEKHKLHISPHKMYFYGGMISAPLPLLWPFCESVVTMTSLHIVSGIGWAAWDVGISLIIYKNIKKQDKLEAVSLYNSVGLPLQVLGTVAGALLLKYVYMNNYSTMFIVAGVIRFLCILPMRANELNNSTT